MNCIKICQRIIVIGLLSASFASAQFESMVRAFETDTGYVKPFATLFGTMTNQAWYQSASVPRAFSFYIGLPVSLSFVSEKDRSFEFTFIDEGCVECNEATPPGDPNGCVEKQILTRPTILGTDRAPKASVSQVDLQGNVVWQDSVLFSDGIDVLNKLPFMPWLVPQIGFSFFHTELKARITPIPTPVFSLYVPGVGLQHDLASVLPKIPVSLSVAGNMSWIIGSFTPPDSNITGSLDLNGLTAFAGILAGYRFKKVEFFLEAGWEYSNLHIGGDLTIAAPDISDPLEAISPDVNLRGRNMFRAGLNIAFPIGYMPVLGGSVGAEKAVTVNIIGYKYQPKDKGKNKAKKESDAEKTEKSASETDDKSIKKTDTEPVPAKETPVAETEKTGEEKPSVNIENQKSVESPESKTENTAEPSPEKDSSNDVSTENKPAETQEMNK